MTLVDILLGIILIGIFAYGLKRGLFKEIASFLGFILGGLAGFFLSKDLAQIFTAFGPIPPKVGVVVAFLLIFFLFLVGFHLLGSFLHKLTQVAMMSWLDHLAGGLFGLVKGGLIVALLVFVVSLRPLPEGIQTRLDNSFIVSHFHDLLVDAVNGCPFCPATGRQELLKLLGPKMRRKARPTMVTSPRLGNFV